MSGGHKVAFCAVLIQWRAALRAATPHVWLFKLRRKEKAAIIRASVYSLDTLDG